MRGFSWLALLVALIVGGDVAAQTPAAERRVALVIGNSAYQHMGRLANPRNDATAMARQLAEMGFEVVGNGPQIDLDKNGMEQAIRDFGRALRGAAVGMFYYAGHGVQVRNRNFLVPITARVESEAEISLVAIDANLAMEQLEASGARLSIVVLDACRNNPFPGGQFRSVGAGLAQMQAAAGTVISFAAQPGAMALDGNADGNSPYTAALLEAMRRPGLNVLDVFNEVGVSVSRATGRSQQPWVSSSPIEGRFYFTPSAETAAREAGPAAPGAAPDAGTIELAFWNAIQGTRNIAAYREYVRQYPEGRFVALARLQITDLERTAQANQPGRPVQVSPPQAAAPPPPRPAAPAAPAAQPAAPQVALAPAAGARTFSGRSNAMPDNVNGSCPPMEQVVIRVTADNQISGSAIANFMRAGTVSYVISGVIAPDGRVNLRFMTTNPSIPERLRTSPFNGNLSGGVIEATQPANTCGRTVRLTAR